LIEEWQPEPLVPDVDENHPVLQNMEKRLVEGQVVALIHVLYKAQIPLGPVSP